MRPALQLIILLSGSGLLYFPLEDESRGRTLADWV